MLSRKHGVRIWAGALCLAAATVMSVRSASADDKDDHRSGQQRIEDRLTKDADDHLKSNLSDDAKRQALKQEIVRAAAVREMAEMLARDSKFQQAYATLVANSAKRSADLMPDSHEVAKEEEHIINDPDATRIVMARAMLLLQNKEGGHR